MWRGITIFLLFQKFISGSSWCSSEPRCSCIDVPEKGLFADCSKEGLHESPVFDPNVTAINLSENKLIDFPFSLPKALQKLDLSFNIINVITLGSLSSMTSLIYLDISNNNLTNIPLDLPMTLQHLNVSTNRIDHLRGKPFRGLFALRNLDMFHNSLPFDASIFYKDIFQDLVNLTHLNIGGNGQQLTTNQPGDECLIPLQSLHTLVLDLPSNMLIGPSFAVLSNLRILQVKMCMTECIGIDFFDNVPLLEEFSINYGCKSYGEIYNHTLRCVEPGAFAKLVQLEKLDISNNKLFGLCALRNITRDLSRTNIKVLKANNIHCAAGRSSTLLISDVLPLQNTSLEELYLDGNKLEMAEPWTASYFPKSLKVLNVADNRWVLGTYAYQGIANLTNFTRIDLRHQLHHNARDIGNYWLCDDFYAIHRCEVFRYNSIKHEWKVNVTDNSKFDCPIPAMAQIVPTTCDYNIHTCDMFFNVEFPPNTQTIRYDFSGLTSEIRAIFFKGNTLKNLTLSGNELTYFKGPMCNVSNVEYLDISGNKCSNVTLYFFVGFTGLKTLKLSDNKLGLSFDTDEWGQIFANQTNLKFLNISSNKITTLPSLFFKNLRNLSILDLSNNELWQWNVSISHMSNLLYVDLSRNQINYFEETSMKLLDENNLNLTIDLSNNNFQCVCSALAFYQWLDKHAHITFVDYETYHCQFTQGENLLLSGKHGAIQHLEKTCASQAILIIVTIFAIVISILIVLFGLVYRFRWKMRYWYYIMRNFFRLGQETNLHSRRYDVFVSYADEDGQFVYEQVIPNLEENGRRNLELCIHKRNFIPGIPVAENITYSIRNSRKTLCIITGHFLKSSWCMFEFNMALTESMINRGRENIFIMIKKEDIPKEDIPLSMLNVFNNQTYIEYPEEERFIDNFWGNILVAVPTAINPAK